MNYGGTNGESVMQLSSILPFSRKEVYRAWTEPELIEKWCCPEDWQVLSVDTNYREGGEYRITAAMPGGRLQVIHGTYLRITPGSGLCYTWNWGPAEGPGRRTITVELQDHEHGTKMILTELGGIGIPERIVRVLQAENASVAGA